MTTPDLTPQQRLANAIAWYTANRDRIRAALPLSLPPVVLSVAWIARFEQVWLPAAQAGKLSGPLAEAYILGRLRAVRRELDVLKMIWRSMKLGSEIQDHEYEATYTRFIDNIAEAVNGQSPGIRLGRKRDLTIAEAMLVALVDEFGADAVKGIGFAGFIAAVRPDLRLMMDWSTTDDAVRTDAAQGFYWRACAAIEQAQQLPFRNSDATPVSAARSEVKGDGFPGNDDHDKLHWHSLDNARQPAAGGADGDPISDAEV